MAAINKTFKNLSCAHVEHSVIYGTSHAGIRHTIRTDATEQRDPQFLADPSYLGDEHYPIGVGRDPDLGPNWYLGPDEMELPTRGK